MSGSTACLFLGSNVENRAKFLARARRAIGHWPRTKILRVSPVVETEPEIVTHQPKFLNQAIEIKTSLRPLPLLIWAKLTEIELGRKKRARFGPREIDIDILRYGKIKMKGPLLKIPHPRLGNSPSIELCLKALKRR